jgi:hypothetical protein
MSRAEVEDACFARYLLESGAACEDRAVIDDDLVASLDKELDVMTVRSSLEFQGSDLSEVVDRHKILIDAVAAGPIRAGRRHHGALPQPEVLPRQRPRRPSRRQPGQPSLSPA